jgi:hypothetical protein
MPEWGKEDRATRVIRVAIYAKAGRPLFILHYQFRGMDCVSWFPCVIAFGISFLSDKKLELLAPSEVLVAAD